MVGIAVLVTAASVGAALHLAVDGRAEVHVTDGPDFGKATIAA